MRRWLFSAALLAGAALALVLTACALSLRGRLHGLDREAAELGEQVRQGELVESFREQLRRQSDSLAVTQLVLPEHRPLPVTDLTHLEEVFRGLAERAGVEPTRFQLEVEALRGDYRQLPLEVTVTGTQATVRAYLLEICRTPCLMRLATVSLKRLEEGRLEMVLGLILDLA